MTSNNKHCSVKTAFAAKTIILFALMLTCISCTSGNSKNQISSKDLVTQGWVDANTYVVVSIGEPNKKLTSQESIRQSSKWKAKSNAQYKIAEDFKLQKIRVMKQAGFETEDFDPEIRSIIQDVKGAVKGGTIVNESYDEENRCTIVYKVKYPDMKKIVRSYTIYD